MALRYLISLLITGSLPAAGFASLPARRLERTLPIVRQPCLPASPLRSNALRRYRTFHLLSIAYAFRPRLRSRLTLSGRTFLRKPRAFDGGDSHSSFRYSYRHSHFQALQQTFRFAFNAPGTLPYPDPEGSAATSVLCFSPVTFSAQRHSTSELLRTL